MISVSYLFEQAPEEEQQEVPPEEQGSLADRIFGRAIQRVPDAEGNEEAAVEDEVAQRLDQEKYSAKVSARMAEERNKDPELKQLKAAEAIHNKEASEDTKALESGVVPEKVAQDKAEIEAAKQAEQQAPPEGNSQGQVAETEVKDYI